MWAKHKTTTFMITKKPNSDQMEPLELTRQDIIPPIALKPITEALEAIVGAASSPEALWVIHPMISKSKMLADQLIGATGA